MLFWELFYYLDDCLDQNFLNVVIISFLWQDMRNINSITLIFILFTDGIVTALNFVLILLDLKDDFGAKFTPLLLEHLAIFMVPSDMYEN